MKRFQLFIFLSAALLAAGCTKQADRMDGYIAGRLFVSDGLATLDSTPVPLAGKKLHIRYASGDTLNFIYSAQTDSDGYFVFNNLYKDKQYRVSYEEANANGTWYRADNLSVQAGNDSLALLITAKATGSFITILPTPTGTI